MRNLALITILLLFIILFTSITKIFTSNLCKSAFNETGQKKELQGSGYCNLIYHLIKPVNCCCAHADQGEPAQCHLENNSSKGSFQHLANIDTRTSIVPYENDNELLELHNTREVTIGYFLFTQ